MASVSGGLAQILQLAELLSDEGFEVTLTYRDAAGPWTALTPERVTLVHMDQAAPAPEDIWLVPEGWPNALAPALGKARCVVWCQNWAYFLSALPEGVRWRDLPVHFLAVSEPVRWFMREFAGVESQLLRPGVDLRRFHPHALEVADVAENAEATLHGPLGVAWMPRKNKAVAHQVREALEHRLALRGAPPPQWVAIERMAPDEVAAALRRCRVFLATGFPEGCPLPPLEAMASGLLVVGSAGVGGWDYMRQAWRRGGFAFSPPYAALEGAAGPLGNGFFTADADAPAMALALDDALMLFETHDAYAAQVVRSAKTTAQRYDLEMMRHAATTLWRRAAGNDLFVNAG